MDPLDLALFAAAMIGVAAAAYMVARRPEFWFGLGLIAWKAGWPKLKLAWLAYKAKHTTEEWQAIRDKAERDRRGGDR